MKLTKLRCDAFAGLTDRELDFAPGLNLIVGENESGKSTLADLIYALLFQSESLDLRRDKEFKERYFPKSAGPWQGDTIDGTLRFETEAGPFRLFREWSGKNGSVRLTLPDGSTVRDGERVRAILRDALRYGRGMYDELIFPSQRRQSQVIDALLGGAASDGVNELAAAVRGAVMETGGVEIDEIEKELTQRLAAYEGHWDFAADQPENGRRRGITNKWAKGVGSILAAWYEKEEAAAAWQEAEQAERAAERINARLLEKRAAREQAQAKRERFLRVRALLVERSGSAQLLSIAERERQEMETALIRWPAISGQRAQLLDLLEERRLAALREQYRAAKALWDEKSALEAELEALGGVDADAVRRAEALEVRIAKDEARFKGLSLSARIRRLGGAELTLRASADGRPIPFGEEPFALTEAVEILVPGAAEIALAPRGVDAEALRLALDARREELATLLKPYGASSAETLREKLRRAETLRGECAALTLRLETCLAGTDRETLEIEGAAVSDDVRALADVERALRALCAGSPEAYLGRLTGELERLSEQYQSPEQLARAEAQKRGQIAKLREKLANAAEMPAEFAAVEDADAFETELKNRIASLDRELDALLQSRAAAEKQLGERSAEELAEQAERAEEAFQREKADCARWKHIYEVFRRVKSEAQGSPLEDVERNFARDLALLTDGELVLEGVGEDLGSAIRSGGSRLTASILSEGTRDTVSLAFRLAVLRHLYPEGGCTAVFDDPFTDMDPKRTAAACRLLQDFARDNQVLFLTCDEKYETLLQGNVIRIRR